MLPILPDRFWLWLNKKRKPLPHPFNMAPNGARKLNYADWEYRQIQGGDGFGVFQRLLPDGELIKNQKIAELACGAGGKSVFLVKSGAKAAYGCDLNPILIQQAREFAQHKNVSDKTEFKVADATATPYPERYFDIVLLSSILEHVNDPEKLIREAVRILRPGGLILINTEGYWHWLGHHLWDGLSIPWLHLFTSEKQRIRLYKKSVAQLADSKERIELRISKNQEGSEVIDYLNHITISKMHKLVKKLSQEGLVSIEQFKVESFNKKILRPLVKIPLVRELFHKQVLIALKR
jgi:ubiquinone/menaquinone biosynthesis C-methylase UbiE